MGTTDYKWDRVIIDADFAIKMNKITDVDAIQTYIPLFVGSYIFMNTFMRMRS